MKPKRRIVLTIKKLYQLAESRYLDFETPEADIRIRLDDNFKLDIIDVTPDRVTLNKTPPNMVN